MLHQEGPRNGQRNDRTTFGGILEDLEAVNEGSNCSLEEQRHASNGVNPAIPILGRPRDLRPQLNTVYGVGLKGFPGTLEPELAAILRPSDTGA